MRKIIAIILVSSLMLLTLSNINEIPEKTPGPFVENERIDHGTKAEDNTTWLEGWQYRRSLNITGKEGAGTDYQINLEAYYDFAYNRSSLTFESIQGIGDFANVIAHNSSLHFGSMEDSGTECYFYEYNTTNKTLTKYLLPHTAGSSDGHHKPIVYRDIYGYWWVWVAYNVNGVYWMRTNYTDRFDSWNGSYLLVDQGTYVYPFQNESTGRLYIIHRKFDGMGSNYTIDYTDNNGTTWTKNQSTIIPSNTGPHNCYYISHWFDNTTETLHISAVGERPSGILEVRENLFYLYSDDYGTTWKDTNGSTITNISDARIVSGSFSRSHINLDSLGRPMIASGLRNDSDRTQNFFSFYHLKDGSCVTSELGGNTSNPWSPKNAPVQIGDTIYVLGITDYTASTGDEYPNVYYSQSPFTDWTRFDFNFTNTRTDDSTGWNFGYDVINNTIYFICTKYDSADDETFLITFPFETDGNKFSLGAKCRTDFEDVRFTDNDGITNLDYWIEYRVNGTFATFWIEVKDNLNTSQSFYVYYGKSNATYTNPRQHGEDTFLFFDGEGWGGEVDWATKWQSTNHSKYNVENGILNFSRGAQDIYTDLIQSQNKYGNGMVFELYLQAKTATSWTVMNFETNVATYTGKDKAMIKQAAPSLHLYLNNVGDQLGRSRDTEQYFKVKFFLPEDGNANISIMGKTYFWFNELIGTPGYRESYLGFVEILAGSYSWMDNVFVRKYTNISVGEPQINTWGDEQLNPDFLYDIILYEDVWNFNGKTNQTATNPVSLYSVIPNCKCIVGKNLTTGYWYTYWPGVGLVEDWGVKYGDGFFILVTVNTTWQVTTYTGSTDIITDIWNPVVYANPQNKAITTIFSSISNITAIVGKNIITGYWYTYWPGLGLNEIWDVKFGDGLFLLTDQDSSWNHT